MRMRSRIPGTFICLLATLCIVPAARAQQAVAEQILRISGVKGGLVVHVGCGDGRLTAALRANDSYMVQGLDTSAQNVARAREHVRSLGLYGDVSVSQYDGKHLPYIDNLVNLVVAQQADEVSRKEIVRVLAPNGVACIERGDNWAKIVKQRPEQMDEWTHYMHDSTGNAVSNDTLVGPPANLQWVGSPRWTRHHEHMSSLNALVSANGRLFYIVDEGSRASIQL
ncbi:MAG: class I SAM-dependent methyltransferase, partial [Planctomycetota bacterium]